MFNFFKGSKAVSSDISPPEKTSSWRDYIDSMETGDLLLFHGSNYWFSYVVEWATWSEFSHIGMVLKDPTYIREDLKGVYMLESGTERFPDAVDHKIHVGVQVVAIDKLMEFYTGRVYLKKLNRPPVELSGGSASVDGSGGSGGSSLPTGVASDFGSVIQHVWKKIEHLPYDSCLWDLMRAEFGIKWGDMHRENRFFCSALVTFLYENFGLFQGQPMWDSVLPEDYNDGKKVEKMLIPEFSLKPKVLLQAKYQ